MVDVIVETVISQFHPMEMLWRAEELQTVR